MHYLVQIKLAAIELVAIEAEHVIERDQLVGLDAEGVRLCG